MKTTTAYKLRIIEANGTTRDWTTTDTREECVSAADAIRNLDGGRMHKGSTYFIIEIVTTETEVEVL